VLRTIIGNFGKELGVEMDFQGTKRLVKKEGSNKIKLSHGLVDIFQVTTSNPSRSSKPGSYSMTFSVRLDEGDNPLHLLRRKPKAYWLTLESKFLLEKFGKEDFELVADVNQQEGGPLRVMLGKPLSHYLLPNGLNQDQKEELLNDIKLDFDRDRPAWIEGGTNKFHVIVRRNPVNRLTFISLPRFAIRYLLEEQDEDMRYELEFVHSPYSPVGQIKSERIICRFDSRTSTMKPLSKERGWITWVNPEEYNIMTLEVKMNKTRY
jgi:hypothetical protein